MARNFYRIFTENNPVMGDSKTFGIPEAKGLKCPYSKIMSHCVCTCIIVMSVLYNMQSPPYIHVVHKNLSGYVFVSSDVFHQMTNGYLRLKSDY